LCQYFSQVRLVLVFQSEGHFVLALPTSGLV